MKEQFPQEIETKRKPLYNIAKEARKNPNNKVRLVRDKLYINNKQYFAGQQIPDVRIQETSSHTSTNVQLCNTEIRKQYKRPYQHPNQNVQYQTNEQLRTRTFKQTVVASRRVPRADRPFTQNRFSAIDSECESTPSRRDRLTGKTKSKSPLDQNIHNKKQREEFSESHSDTEETPAQTRMDTTQQQQQQNTETIDSNQTDSQKDMFSQDDQQSRLSPDAREFTPSAHSTNIE